MHAGGRVGGHGLAGAQLLSCRITLFIGLLFFIGLPFLSGLTIGSVV